MADDIHSDDESLMVRIQKGDHQAFSILVRRHAQRFFAAAYRMSGRADEAEDVVQEAFLKLWQRPQAFDAGKGAKFTTWFYRVVTNLAIDKGRRRKNEVGPSALDFIADDRESAQACLEVSEKGRAVEAAIQSLPARQKLALNLCFYEELSNKEAAEILGVGVKALESLLMRAKAALKEKLARQDVGRRNG